MKTLTTRLMLTALGIVAILTTPALAKKPHHVARSQHAAIYNTMPGYNDAGQTVGIPISTQYGLRNDYRYGLRNDYQYGVPAAYQLAIRGNAPAIYDMIPGYNDAGRTVWIPNPDRFGLQPQR